MMRAMPKPPRPWIVAPHDPIVKLEDNLWAVDGEVPGMKMRRRMAIARREDGTLVFFNAVPVADEALAAIRGFGKPAALIVPNNFHRLDIHAFRERLGLKLYCGAGAEKKVAQVAPVDGRIEELAAADADATVRVTIVDGTRSGEAAMTVRSGARASVVFCDAFMNLPRPLGMLTRIMRTAGGPKCPPLFRLAMVKDRRAVRGSLERLAETPGLVRLVPSHGDVVEGADAAATLRRVAARDLS
jgi:hypothetical protein